MLWAARPKEPKEGDKVVGSDVQYEINWRIQAAWSKRWHQPSLPAREPWYERAQGDRPTFIATVEEALLLSLRNCRTSLSELKTDVCVENTTFKLLQEVGFSKTRSVQPFCPKHFLQAGQKQS